MFAARVFRLTPQAKNLAAQSRNMSALSGPPTEKISFPEKVAHGVVMTLAFMAIPTWVLVNIKKYRGIE